MFNDMTFLFMFDILCYQFLVGFVSRSTGGDIEKITLCSEIIVGFRQTWDHGCNGAFSLPL
jgi:hypothetical protein